jgi:hypothetical protein
MDVLRAELDVAHGDGRLNGSVYERWTEDGIGLSPSARPDGVGEAD